MHQIRKVGHQWNKMQYNTVLIMGCLDEESQDGERSQIPPCVYEQNVVLTLVAHNTDIKKSNIKLSTCYIMSQRFYYKSQIY